MYYEVSHTKKQESTHTHAHTHNVRHRHSTLVECSWSFIITFSDINPNRSLIQMSLFSKFQWPSPLYPALYFSDTSCHTCCLLQGLHIPSSPWARGVCSCTFLLFPKVFLKDICAMCDCIFCCVRLVTNWRVCLCIRFYCLSVVLCMSWSVALSRFLVRDVLF